MKILLNPVPQEVCRCLDVDLTGQTSASFNMRQNYERCLFEFEDYLSSGAYIADVNAGLMASHHTALLPLMEPCPVRHACHQAFSQTRARTPHLSSGVLRRAGSGTASAVYVQKFSERGAKGKCYISG